MELELQGENNIRNNTELLNEERDDELNESIRTEFLLSFSKKLSKIAKQDQPLLPHTEGYIFGFRYFIEKVSFFRIQIFSINGYICSLILLTMLTFQRQYPTDWLIAVCILSIISQLILIVDTYYLNYYRRWPNWIYSYNFLEILFWIITFLNFSETCPIIYKSLTHFVYITNPLIYIGTLVFSCVFPHDPKAKIFPYFSHTITVGWSIYRTLILMKILDIGLGSMKIWLLFIPIIAYLLVMLLFSLFFFAYTLWLCVFGRGFQNNYDKAMLEVACVIFPISSFYLFFVFTLDPYFENGRYNLLFLIHFWILICLAGIWLSSKGVLRK